jgi:hypothetical protein
MAVSPVYVIHVMIFVHFQCHIISVVVGVKCPDRLRRRIAWKPDWIVVVDSSSIFVIAVHKYLATRSSPLPSSDPIGIRQVSFQLCVSLSGLYPDPAGLSSVHYGHKSTNKDRPETQETSWISAPNLLVWIHPSTSGYVVLLYHRRKSHLSSR